MISKEYPYYVVTKLDEHIIKIDWLANKDNLTADYAMVDDLVAQFEKACEGKKQLLLMNFQKTRIKIPADVRKYISEHPILIEFKLAEGIVTQSLFMKALLNMYLKAFAPKNPVRVFRSEKEAISWLNQFVQILK